MKKATVPQELPSPQRDGVKPLQIRNVLLPIDFSVASLQAFELALPLLKRFGANLDMVYVFEPNHSLASIAAVPLIVPELEVGRRVRRHMRGVAREHGIELRRENIHCLKGRPFEGICSLARERGTDLIVIATRGNTGLKHLLLGSTAEQVVRFSPCPVLVVRSALAKQEIAGANGRSRVGLDFKKILVPLDFSDCSMKGLAWGKRLAKEFDAELVLISSVALQYYVGSDEYARYDFPMVMEQTEKMARKQMQELMEKTDWEGVRVESSIQVGHAGDQICARAREQDIDLIVTSTHGRTGFKHVLIGSTAEYVVRHAHCPVLVVPSHDRPTLEATVTEL